MATYQSGETFDLGNVLATGERIKSARQQRNFLAEQERRAQQSFAGKQEDQQANRQKENLSMLYQAATEVEVNPGSIGVWSDQLKRSGVDLPYDDLQSMPPEQIQQKASELRAALEPAIQRLAGDNEKGTYGLNPVWGVDPQGSPIPMQLSSSGGVQPVNVPDGYRFSEPVSYTNLGDVMRVTGTKTGRVQGDVAKGISPEQTPSFKAAVTSAESRVKEGIETEKERKKSDRAYKIYATGMQRVVNALGKTTTGPFIGMTPALTSSAQIAEGAKSAMAPVLKQMFRSSGEGVFTDKDQDLLMGMLPDRNDLPETIREKALTMDRIVKAKLGIGSDDDVELYDRMIGSMNAESADRQGRVDQVRPANDQQGQLMIDANGNKAIVYPDGTYKEVQ